VLTLLTTVVQMLM